MNNMCTNKSFLNGKSKELAYLLRHDTTYNFPNDGYREVKDLFENHNFTYPILEKIVRTDKKGRYFQAYCTHRRGPQRPGDESESQLCHEKFIDKNQQKVLTKTERCAIL